jgi:acetoin utilization protein AcuC
MVSIHEAGRWPHTGALEDAALGHALNLPVPRGLNDAELALLMQDLVLPFAARFRPQAVVVTCGADALDGDPLARMALGNVALWKAVESTVALAPVSVVLGGGGYNPWTLARYWTGIWGRLSGRAIPAALPDSARAILARLSCDLVDDEDVRPEWLTTLGDERRPAPARGEILALRDAALARVEMEVAA